MFILIYPTNKLHSLRLRRKVLRLRVKELPNVYKESYIYRLIYKNAFFFNDLESTYTDFPLKKYISTRYFFFN